MLSLKHWQNQRAEFEAAGVRLPALDVEKAKAAGVARPRWIHIGGGNLFRTFHADAAQQLLDKGLLDRGLVVADASGELTPAAREEMAAGPEAPRTSMGIVAAMLHARFVAGAAPIAMVITDNFSQNGRKFRASVTTVARGWLEAGKVDAAFVDYVSDERRASFPWSMIGRITPSPSPEVADKLASEGFADVELIKTHGGTTFAGLANTEEAHDLVIEDGFPAGAPRSTRRSSPTSRSRSSGGCAASSTWTTGAKPSRPAPARCWPSCRCTSPRSPSARPTRLPSTAA